MTSGTLQDVPLRDVRNALQIIDRTMGDLYTQMHREGADREYLESRIAYLRDLRSKILAKAVDTIEKQFEEEE